MSIDIYNEFVLSGPGEYDKLVEQLAYLKKRNLPVSGFGKSLGTLSASAFFELLSWYAPVLIRNRHKKPHVDAFFVNTIFHEAHHLINPTVHGIVSKL